MQHVMIDLYQIDPARLTDRALLLKVLSEYPGEIGMEAAGPPVLRDITTSTPLDDGMSGFTIIYTSHCSLHAWPEYGMVNLDVFSCNSFETERAVAFAKAMFATEDAEVHVVERATRSPREMVMQEASRVAPSSCVSHLTPRPQPLI